MNKQGCAEVEHSCWDGSLDIYKRGAIYPLEVGVQAVFQANKNSGGNELREFAGADAFGPEYRGFGIAALCRNEELDLSKECSVMMGNVLHITAFDKCGVFRNTTSNYYCIG